MDNYTQVVDHRPWPLPNSPWVMFQRWEKLLFAHWALPPEQIAPLIPEGLELDTFEGQAWVGVVPFLMRGIRPRGLFPVPWLSAFAELNVRTYVKVGNKTGVLFFSLDAANPMGVYLGRNWYQLPYFNAEMPVKIEGKSIDYSCHRTHRKARAADFKATYRPTSEVFRSEAGTLDYFLTERYCLYAVGRGGRLVCGEIHHLPWPLQRAEAEITQNTMPPFELPETAPLLHYVDGLDVVVWPLKRV